MDRLQKFREGLARLDPLRPIRGRDEQTWYVVRPDKVATLIANTFHLEPASSHLVIGSIGCGKSTELLAAGRQLIAAPGVFARYVEVSTVLDPKDATAEALLLSLARELLDDLLSADPFSEDDELQRTAGPLLEEIDHVQQWLQDPYGYATVRPASRREGQRRPDRADEPDPGPLGEHQEIVRDIRNLVRDRHHGSLVWLIDGLDRLQDPLAFDELVTPVLQLLKSLCIGVVVVAPRRVVAGLDRLGAPSDFDEIHAVGPIDPSSAEGKAFLSDVLASRGVSTLVPPACVAELIRLSGGVLRMLLQLTRQAVKETYVRGEDQVAPAHVELAADKLGRDLVLGLDSQDVRVLLALHSTGTFAGRADRDLALVRSNRVLEYMAKTGQRRYVVHPCLAPFLPTLEAELDPPLFDDGIPF